MKHLVLAAVAISLLVFPAGAGPRNDYAAASHRPYTQAFVREAAMMSMFEIEAARLARRKPTDPVHNIFADAMIADHSKMLDELKLIVADFRGMRMPFRLDAERRRELRALQILSGPVFEEQYRADQIERHRKAIRVFRDYARNGPDHELKSWSREWAHKLEGHLDRAQALPKPSLAM